MKQMKGIHRPRDDRIHIKKCRTQSRNSGYGKNKILHSYYNIKINIYQ